MKVIYFIAINIIAIVAMCAANMYSFINNIEHTNSIYFWIITYAFVIASSIMGMNCRNQILRLEELIEIRLRLDPTEEEEMELLAMVEEDYDTEEEHMEEEHMEETKRRFFKKRA